MTTVPQTLAVDTLVAGQPGHVNLHKDERTEINKLSQARLDGVPVRVIEVSTTLPTAEELGAAPDSLVGRVESLEASGSAVGVRPSGNGLVGWSYDPVFIFNGTVLGSGNLHVVKVPVGASGPLARVFLAVYAVQAGQTAAGVAIYNEAGVLLAKADAGTAFDATGIRSIPIPSPPNVAPGIYQVAFFSVATTPPSIGRSSSTSVGHWGNLGLSAAASLRYALAGTVTDLASVPATLPVKTSIQQTFFAGLAAA